MSSQRTFNDAPSAPPFQLFNLQSKPGTPAGRFYAEDGWIFREYPGKGIEIICRYEPPATAVSLQDLQRLPCSSNGG
jgi:hypothetical protein